MIKETVNLALLLSISALATLQDAILGDRISPATVYPTIINSLLLVAFAMLNTGWIILSEYNVLFAGLEFMLLSIIAICYYSMYAVVVNRQSVMGLIAPVLLGVVSLAIAFV